MWLDGYLNGRTNFTNTDTVRPQVASCCACPCTMFSNWPELMRVLQFGMQILSKCVVFKFYVLVGIDSRVQQIQVYYVLLCAKESLGGPSNRWHENVTLRWAYDVECCYWWLWWWWWRTYELLQSWSSYWHDMAWYWNVF